jgi:hypothetical protein
MVRMLDHRNLQPARDQQRKHVFDQRGLAVPRVGREAEDFQRIRNGAEMVILSLA